MGFYKKLIFFNLIFNLFSNILLSYRVILYPIEQKVELFFEEPIYLKNIDLNLTALINLFSGEFTSSFIIIKLNDKKFIIEKFRNPFNKNFNFEKINRLSLKFVKSVKPKNQQIPNQPFNFKILYLDEVEYLSQKLLEKYNLTLNSTFKDFEKIYDKMRNYLPPRFNYMLKIVLSNNIHSNLKNEILEITKYSKDENSKFINKILLTMINLNPLELYGSLNLKSNFTRKLYYLYLLKYFKIKTGEYKKILKEILKESLNDPIKELKLMPLVLKW